MRSINCRNSIATALCAVIILTVMPRLAGATSGNPEDRPIRLYGTAYVGPIGWISTGSLNKGSLMINGRAVLSEEAVWSGDLLQTAAGARVSVWLESIGAVGLSGGASVRLASRSLGQADGSKSTTLIASLVQGEISVDLAQSAKAYVRAPGAAYASSPGAAFRATVREGRASFAVRTGEVRREEQSSQHQYTIRPVGHGSNIRVEGGSLVRLQVQVLEDDKPVPGVGVLFALDTSAAVIGLLGMGTLTGTTANVATDADGMAAVQFVARDSSGAGPISATVEGTRVAWTGMITVTTHHDSRGSMWGIAVIAGAAAAAGIGWALTRSDKDPLEAQPPVVK